jgi:DNA helicase IV
MATPATTDPVLTAEGEHLRRAREHLGHMRSRAERIADYGVDALASEALGKARAQRLKALADDPHVPPFFGRVDRQPDEEHLGGETFHIGRRHVRDDAGDPLVIDWRAPMAVPFYRATTDEPMSLRRRRRFGFVSGRLTSYEDERLDRPGAHRDGVQSQILLQEIERPRVGPMRDIVATIQPDQDGLVRASLDDSICVQGAPGTGKTAVGLHRAAYLLYTYPDRLRRSGVLVVGPNRAFLSYIGAVLPALGEAGVGQQTIEQLLSPVPIRGTEPPAVATLKGDPRMAEVLRRAVYSGISRPRDSVMIPVGTRRYRVPAERLRRYVDDLRRGEARYQAARDRLHLLVAEDLRRQREAAGGAPTDAETARVARSASVRAFVDAVWPAVDAPGLVYRLLSDPEALAAAADGLLEPDEQRLLLWPSVPRSVRATKWTEAEAVLVDEVTGLLERPSTYGHVVLDEAQDLSPMQCRGVARRCPTGSITVLGDLAQGTTPWATSDWHSTLAHLGKADARIEPLTRGYRVPAEVISLANRLLPHLAQGLSPATSVRTGAGGLRLHEVERELAASIVAEVGALLAEEGSIGVIAADGMVDEVRAALAAAGVRFDVLGEDADHDADDAADGALDEESNAAEDAASANPPADRPRVTIVPATLAKGLEYDSVLVVEPAAIVAAEPRGLRRLYVVLTRAVSRLIVLHHRPLPPQLAA